MADTTLWKSSSIVNANTTLGGQRAPQSISLADGNILVVWEDDVYGPSGGTDIMGQYFDIEGNPIGVGAFQINTTVVTTNETRPQIVALPDGGYVVAYHGSNASGGFIQVERYGATGLLVFSDSIVDPADSQANWKVITDPAGNYSVVFHQNSSTTDPDIYSITYDGTTNARGPLRIAGLNSDARDFLGAAAALPNGHIVTLGADPDDDYVGPSPFPLTYWSVELTIIDPVSGSKVRGSTDIAGTGALDDAYAKGIAVLTGGQIVLLYQRHYEIGEDGLHFRIMASETGAIGPEVFVAPSINTDARLDTVKAQVVALKDGGFLVVWNEPESTALRGQAFDAAGNKVGTFSGPFANNLAATAEATASLTTDGRVVVTYENTAGDISSLILDPRGTNFSGTNASETITTNSISTILYGAGGDDRLLGQGGNDTLDGGPGIDNLEGGASNDIYVLRDVFNFRGTWQYDRIFEEVRSGIDTVLVARTPQTSEYTLPANVENGLVLNTGVFTLRGNGSANSLTGNGDFNRLEGYEGDDMLDGAGGADIMAGGTGNDRYIVNHVGDVAYEALGEGTDWVFASISYTLPQSVEVEFLSTTTSAGTTAINLTGNNFANRLQGNNGANRLDGSGAADEMYGFGGNDIYIVDHAGDLAIEYGGGGNDHVYTSVSYTLVAGSEVETLSTTSTLGTVAIDLTGNQFVQHLIGNNGNNRLDGGTGSDTMSGLGGDDRYFADSSGDSVIESVGGGNDVVVAATNYSLTFAAEVETLMTPSTASTTAINLTGNNLSQTILGNNGANVLNGGYGNDTLQGFGGADIFLFNTTLSSTGNVDTIVGYSTSQNIIHLDNSVFTGLPDGALAAGAFRIASAALDPEDRIIYDSASGALIFDMNGSGANGAVVFANVGPGLAMTSAEFFVV